MARNDPQLNFRIPSELKDRLDASAKENGRSLTAELVARLEESYSGAAENSLVVKFLEQELAMCSAELRRMQDANSPFMKNISSTIQDQVHMVMRAKKLGFEDALLLITTRGAALETPAPIAILQAAKGTTAAEARALVSALDEVMPQDASFFYEQGLVPKSRMLSTTADLKRLRKK